MAKMPEQRLKTSLAIIALLCFAVLVLALVPVRTVSGQTTYANMIYRAITLSKIDSTPIGSTTPASGNFTTLSLSGSAASNHTLCGNGSNYVDAATCGTASLPRTCNGNGCYIKTADGTIIQWGTVGGCGGSGQCDVPVTFPTSFTTASSVAVSAIVLNGANNYGATAGAISTSGVTIGFGSYVFVGGSGSSLSGSQSASWMAIGY